MPNPLQAIEILLISTAIFVVFYYIYNWVTDEC